jgi:hypothetical protein
MPAFRLSAAQPRGTGNGVAFTVATGWIATRRIESQSRPLFRHDARDAVGALCRKHGSANPARRPTVTPQTRRDTVSSIGVSNAELAASRMAQIWDMDDAKARRVDAETSGIRTVSSFKPPRSSSLNSWRDEPGGGYRTNGWHVPPERAGLVGIDRSRHRPFIGVRSCILSHLTGRDRQSFITVAPAPAAPARSRQARWHQAIRPDV